MAGVSVPYLSEVERGRKEPSSEVLAAICRALGLHLAELLEQVRDELSRIEPADPVRRVSPPRAERASVADSRIPHHLRCQRISRQQKPSPSAAAGREAARVGYLGEHLARRPGRGREL